MWRGIPIILSHTPPMWEELGGVENPVDAILLKVFFDRPIICFNNICIQILNRCNQWFRN